MCKKRQNVRKNFVRFHSDEEKFEKFEEFEEFEEFEV